MADVTRQQTVRKFHPASFSLAGLLALVTIVAVWLGLFRLSFFGSCIFLLFLLALVLTSNQIRVKKQIQGNVSWGDRILTFLVSVCVMCFVVVLVGVSWFFLMTTFHLAKILFEGVPL